MMPHEAWAKEKPQVEHLRVFGCDVYAHIPKDERQKLNPKTRNAFFWGMVMKQKGINFMTQVKVKYFIAVM